MIQNAQKNSKWILKDPNFWDCWVGEGKTDVGRLFLSYEPLMHLSKKPGIVLTTSH